MNNTDKDIYEKIKKFCDEHSLDFNSFDNLINERKLVPMLRGIGFEYVVINDLSKLLKMSFLTI